MKWLGRVHSSFAASQFWPCGESTEVRISDSQTSGEMAATNEEQRTLLTIVRDSDKRMVMTMFERPWVKFALSSTVASLLFLSDPADSCTAFRVASKDGAILVGRSMEFGMDMKSTVMIVPRGFRLSSPAPGGAEGLSWKAKYGFVGMNALGLDIATDGLNEAGLSVHMLLLPGYAKYQDVGPQDAAHALAHICVANWILSNFASTEEVKEAIGNATVFRYEPPGIGFLPLHYAVYDGKRSIVIEYVNGERHVYDNPVGVMTNSPPFDWQLTNLRNYINLTNLNVDSLKLGSYTLEPIGQGTGLLGIPGDYTPPHRFVRATALAYAALQPATASEGANLAFHILNSVDIPLGAIAGRESASNGATTPAPNAPARAGGLTYDLTQWVTVSDLTNKIYYFRTYKNLAIRKVELKKVSFNGPAIQHIDIERGDAVVDVTKQAH
jgi:choloylglycine hydrolase